MKHLLLLGGLFYASQAMAAGTTSYIVEESPSHVVFLNGPKHNRGTIPQVALAYYELFQSDPDYVYVTVLQVDCLTPNKLQINQKTATHLRYNTNKNFSTPNIQHWMVFPQMSVQSKIWDLACAQQNKYPATIQTVSTKRLMQRYFTP